MWSWFQYIVNCLWSIIKDILHTHSSANTNEIFTSYNICHRVNMATSRRKVVKMIVLGLSQKQSEKNWVVDLHDCYI